MGVRIYATSIASRRSAGVSPAVAWASCPREVGAAAGWTLPPLQRFEWCSGCVSETVPPQPARRPRYELGLALLPDGLCDSYFA